MPRGNQPLPFFKTGVEVTDDSVVQPKSIAPLGINGVVVNESVRPKIRTGEKGGVQTGKYAFLVAPQMPKARRVNEPAAVRTFEGLRFVHEGQAPRGQMNIQAPIQHPTVLIPAVPTLGCQLQTVHLPTVFNDGHVAGLVGRTRGNRLPNSQF